MVKDKKMPKGKTKIKISIPKGKKAEVQIRNSNRKPQKFSILVKMKRLFRFLYR